MQFDWQAQWIRDIDNDPPLEVLKSPYKLQHMETSRYEYGGTQCIFFRRFATFKEGKLGRSVRQGMGAALPFDNHCQW